MNRTITAYFESRTDAQAAADQLRNSGVSVSDISIHDAGSTTTTSTTSSEGKGFWESLGDLFMPDEDRYSYSEGIRRGGSVLSVRADELEFDRVCDMLESAGAVDMDNREAEWRSEGWSGYDEAAGSRATTDRGSGEMMDREDYIPVAEEELRVGKREVGHGRVRVRSYVREMPVEEQVRLRDETVDVERRPVDRPATADDDLFEERMIEADERQEEAVVSKEAHVTEEVRLRKEAEEREETIRDTVRRTDVEVEDERTGRRLSDEERARRGS